MLLSVPSIFDVYVMGELADSRTTVASADFARSDLTLVDLGCFESLTISGQSQREQGGLCLWGFPSCRGLASQPSNACTNCSV